MFPYRKYQTDAWGVVMVSVAVVTVCYNDSSALKKTLRSVAEQETAPDEYIVVDGGSTDETCSLLKDAADIVTRWVSEKDGGIYDAMNKAVRLALSDYIIFINAGDAFNGKDIVSILKSAISSAPAPKPDVVYGDVVLAYPGQSFTRTLPAKGMERLYRMMPCSHQSVLIRRDVLSLFPFRLNVGMIADWCQLVDIKRSGGSFLKLNCAISVFEKSGVSSVPLSRLKNDFGRYSWARRHGLLSFRDNFVWMKRIANEVVVCIITMIAPSVRYRYLQSKSDS